MPDIYGKYSLTELSRELDVTPAFINRIQRETGIGGSIGTKGHAASFTLHYLEIFKRIKALRWIGFTFPEIKSIWEAEERGIKEAKKRNITNEDLIEEFGALPNPWHFILHINDKYRSLPQPQLKELQKIAVEVDRRRTQFVSEVGRLDEALRQLTKGAEGL